MKQLLAATLVLLAMAAGAGADNWPAWRGAEANRYSREKSLPVKWSPTEGWGS